VRRRLRQSEMLRRRVHARIDPAALKPGDYVVLRGVVGASDAMVSPGQHVQCVRYLRRKVRALFGPCFHLLSSIAPVHVQTKLSR
jgi:hypothetical protein